jgi:hypothetical protein
MNEINDEQLRARFDALGSQDRRHEPEFRQVWNRAELAARNAVPAFPSQLRWIVAVAAIVLAVVGVAKARNARDDRPVAMRTSAISSWQSPTAGLLQTISRDLLAPPPLLSSVFDGVTQTALQSKAD